MPSPAIDEQAPAPAAQTIEPTATSAERSLLVDASCRALDIVGAATLLLVAAPLLILIAVAVRLDSPGPPVFRQQRIGRNRKPFTVNKFRTMHHGASHDRHRDFVLGLIRGEKPSSTRPEPETSERPGSARNRTADPTAGEHSVDYFKMISDPRVTRVGRILRRSSLDELPQLWNVLRGDMSLVGPRPAIPYEVENYPPTWFARFAVKPGITGLWQVSGRSKVTLEEMVRLDVEYARRRSIWFDLLILARTVPAVLGARGAW